METATVLPPDVALAHAVTQQAPPTAPVATAADAHAPPTRAYKRLWTSTITESGWLFRFLTLRSSEPPAAASSLLLAQSPPAVPPEPRWLHLDCGSRHALVALALMEAKSSSIKKETEAMEEAERVVKKQNVTMAMEVFDCPVCSTPLRPPVFQCALGHFVCSPCRDKLPDSKCQACSGVVLKSSCYGIERIVESILVPCPYAEHGCTDMITYYLKGEHKQACPHEPCYCPEPGCGFAGTTAALLDHFTSQHKWPTTVFKYYVLFDLIAKPGMHVLRAQDGNLFLLNVSSPESVLHGISLVRIQPKVSELSRFGCSVGFSCWKGHYQLSSLDAITSTSLSDGLPKSSFFSFVPKSSAVLTVTIDTELMCDINDDELEEETSDDDDSYGEEDGGEE
ncbi:putative E3 ubiquitin-protein ligase SINA-like 6 [Triticum dicoccoides]|uniref:putative E3 ubiquitin-protein ligase SINA-like 6 n=1 Tax=Triticum dicoccoides TaxID=85692 RepID=UPI00188DCC24|nr:putative E3 ubiquitin-protein ligase SINA-like 6 [Triticum dicoccoides]